MQQPRRRSWCTMVLTSLILGGALLALFIRRNQLPGENRALMNGWWYGPALPCSPGYTISKSVLKFETTHTFSRVHGDRRCFGSYRVDHETVPPTLIITLDRLTVTYALTLTDMTLILRDSQGAILTYTWYEEFPCDVLCF